MLSRDNPTPVIFQANSFLRSPEEAPGPAIVAHHDYDGAQAPTKIDGHARTPFGDQPIPYGGLVPLRR